MKIKLIGKKYFLKTIKRKMKSVRYLQCYIPIPCNIKKGENVLVQKVELVYNTHGKVVKFKRLGEPFIKLVSTGPRIYFSQHNIFVGDDVLINKIEIIEDEIEII